MLMVSESELINGLNLDRHLREALEVDGLSSWLAQEPTA
jgi:hypothetical protein